MIRNDWRRSSPWMRAFYIGTAATAVATFIALWQWRPPACTDSAWFSGDGCANAQITAVLYGAAAWGISVLGALGLFFGVRRLRQTPGRKR